MQIMFIGMTLIIFYGVCSHFLGGYDPLLTKFMSYKNVALSFRLLYILPEKVRNVFYLFGHNINIKKNEIR